MDLKKMEYFESVSRLKSFTKAAEELHVAQPSITVSILKLEEELGVSLLYRNQRSVDLTKEGEIFLERVKSILNNVGNVVNEMYDLGSKANRELKLAIPTSLGSWMFPIIFSEYAAQYPHVILNILEIGVQSIIDKVSDGTIELGLIVLSDPSPSYMTLPFYHGELLVMVHKEHPLSKYEKIPFEILKDEKFILCSRGSYIRKRIMAECTEHSFTPNILFNPLQVATAFNMVASGVGITFVLDDAIPIVKDNPHIVIRPLVEPMQFQAGFIWGKDKYLSAIAQDFIKFMQKKKMNIRNELVR